MKPMICKTLRCLRGLLGMKEGGYIGDVAPKEIHPCRAWWKCEKCGAFFEAYETPPRHTCRPPNSGSQP